MASTQTMTVIAKEQSPFETGSEMVVNATDFDPTTMEAVPGSRARLSPEPEAEEGNEDGGEDSLDASEAAEDDAEAEVEEAPAPRRRTRRG